MNVIVLWNWWSSLFTCWFLCNFFFKFTTLKRCCWCTKRSYTRKIWSHITSYIIFPWNVITNFIFLIWKLWVSIFDSLNLPFKWQAWKKLAISVSWLCYVLTLFFNQRKNKWNTNKICRISSLKKADFDAKIFEVKWVIWLSKICEKCQPYNFNYNIRRSI